MVIDNTDKLTDKDVEILNELQKNCRENLDKIAKKCGCSRYKIGRTMKKLEEKKIIIGYKAVVNPNNLDIKYYTILVKRTSKPLTETIIKNLSRGAFTDILPEMDINLIDTMYVHGYYDFVINFFAEDVSKAKELCNRIMESYYPYIEKVELLNMVMPFRFNGVRILQPKEKSRIL